MRACWLIAIFALAGFNAEAQQATPKYSTPDPQIKAHIAGIAGPRRSIIVVIEGTAGSPSGKQSVQIRGTIPEVSVIELVHSAIAAENGYWQEQGTWEVVVVGDTKYAMVGVTLHCSALCSHGIARTYKYDQGTWVLKYWEGWIA